MRPVIHEPGKKDNENIKHNINRSHCAPGPFAQYNAENINPASRNIIT